MYTHKKLSLNIIVLEDVHMAEVTFFFLGSVSCVQANLFVDKLCRNNALLDIDHRY